MKPRLVLLDADVIIEAHNIGVWQDIIKGYEVLVPSIIIEDQAKFYSKQEQRTTIDLKSQVAQHQIQEIQTTTEEIECLYEKFARNPPEIHPGETEAVAYIFCHSEEGHVFCTGDHAAIIALTKCGMSDKVISFEELLNKIGLTKTLKKQLTESYRKDVTKKASTQKIMEQGTK